MVLPTRRTIKSAPTDAGSRLAETLTSLAEDLRSAATAIAGDSAFRDVGSARVLAVRVARGADVARAAAELVDSQSASRRLLATIALHATAAEYAGLHVERQVGPIPEDLPESIAEAFAQAASCLVDNAIRRANARHLTVQLLTSERAVTLLVADDGRGFDQDDVVLNARVSSLTVMRERIAQAGGALSLTSAPGLGTRAEVRFRVSAAGRNRPEVW
jgi:two-component sensor histidine kinase